jgi:hypothetical protein
MPVRSPKIASQESLHYRAPPHEDEGVFVSGQKLAQAKDAGQKRQQKQYPGQGAEQKRFHLRFTIYDLRFEDNIRKS